MVEGRVTRRLETKLFRFSFIESSIQLAIAVIAVCKMSGSEMQTEEDSSSEVNWKVSLNEK